MPGSNAIVPTSASVGTAHSRGSRRSTRAVRSTLPMRRSFPPTVVLASFVTTSCIVCFRNVFTRAKAVFATIARLSKYIVEIAAFLGCGDGWSQVGLSPYLHQTSTLKKRSYTVKSRGYRNFARKRSRAKLRDPLRKSNFDRGVRNAVADSPQEAGRHQQKLNRAGCEQSSKNGSPEPACARHWQELGPPNARPHDARCFIGRRLTRPIQASMAAGGGGLKLLGEAPSGSDENLNLGHTGRTPTEKGRG